MYSSEFEDLLSGIEDFVKVPKGTTENKSELKKVIFINMLLKEMDLNFQLRINNKKIILEEII